MELKVGDEVTTPAISGGKVLNIPGIVIGVSPVGVAILYPHLCQVDVVTGENVTLVSRPGPEHTVREAYQRASEEAGSLYRPS